MPNDYQHNLKNAINTIQKMVYLAFIVSAVYLLQGCAIGSLDFTEQREITVTDTISAEKNSTSVTIKGDIESYIDYPELHILIDKIKKH